MSQKKKKRRILYKWDTESTNRFKEETAKTEYEKRGDTGSVEGARREGVRLYHKRRKSAEREQASNGGSINAGWRRGK